MDKPMQGILKEIGTRLGNIGKIVDTDPNNDDEITSNDNNDNNNNAGALATIIKGLKNMGGADISNTANMASAATSAAASDKSIKDISNTNTADIIEKAYKQLDDIIYKYNEKGQALGEDDKLRAGITAQSMEGSILESAVIEDPNTGYKMVDTRHLALANAAAIKEIFERLDKLEGKNEV